MQVDYPGSIVAFKDVKAGAFFVHFAGGALGRAMKIQSAAAPATIAVLSFSDSLHPKVPGPVVLDTTQFDNRDVLVFKDATLRPPRELTTLLDGSPPQQDKFNGSLILAAGSIYIRAPQGSRFLWDIDMNTGKAKNSSAHPGSMWIDDWEIILPQPGGDIVLCSRDKPAA